MNDTMNRKKVRKPAHLLKGKYSQKELEERKQNDEKIAKQFTKDDLKNIPESLDERGVTYYKLLLEQLDSVPLFVDLDKPMLTNLADHLAIIEEARIDRKINGNLIKTSTGSKTNPSLRIIKDYTASYLNLAKALALTPEMRQYMQKLTEENTSAYATEDNVDFLNDLLQGAPKQ